MFFRNKIQVFFSTTIYQIYFDLAQNTAEIIFPHLLDFAHFPHVLSQYIESFSPGEAFSPSITVLNVMCICFILSKPVYSTHSPITGSLPFCQACKVHLNYFLLQMGTVHYLLLRNNLFFFFLRSSDIFHSKQSLKTVYFLLLPPNRQFYKPTQHTSAHDFRHISDIYVCGFL